MVWETQNFHILMKVNQSPLTICTIDFQSQSNLFVKKDVDLHMGHIPVSSM